MLERFAEDDIEHRAMPGVRKRLNPRPPLFDGRARQVAIRGEDGLLRLLSLALGLDLRLGDLIRAAAHVADGVVQPPDLSVFARDHVLVGIVDLVVPDVTGGGYMPL